MQQSFYDRDMDNKVSAHFPPLTLEDLDSNKKQTYTSQFQKKVKQKILKNNFTQQSDSSYSDFELSQGKLRQLGVDLSIQHNNQRQSTPSEDVEGSIQQLKIIMLAMRQRQNDFSRSVQMYTRKFDSGDSTHLFSRNEQSQNQDISMRMDNFKQKLQEIQHDLNSQVSRSPTSDPYKISIQSLHREGNQDQYQSQNQNQRNQFSGSQQPVQRQPNQYTQPQKSEQIYKFTQSRQPSSSLSSGGLSFQGPQLYSTSNKKGLYDPIKMNQQQNLSDLELHRIKYYDSFLPEGQRMMNCPFKLLKYKIQTRDKQALTRCLEDFNLLDIELTQSLKL